MRKMSFRATGSDAALWIRTREKSKEIAATRLGYFVRIIVDDVSPLLSLSLSFSLCVCVSMSLFDALYLSGVLSRDSTPKDRRSQREKRKESKVEELAHRGRSGPGIKTLKITEFLLECFGSFSRARSGIGARVARDLFEKEIRVSGY